MAASRPAVLDESAAGDPGTHRLVSATISAVMPLQTIDEVISALDTIVQQSYDKASRLGYFAALYRRVTCAVRDGISSWPLLRTVR